MRLTADGHPSDELLSAYLAEAIDDPAVEAAVSAHLAACAACREQVAQLQIITALLAELPAPSLPRSFALTREELERLRPRPWYLRYQPVFRWASAVATVLLVALLGLDLLTAGPAAREGSGPAVNRQALPEPTAATPVAALSAPTEPIAGAGGPEGLPRELLPAGKEVPTESSGVMAAPAEPTMSTPAPSPTPSPELGTAMPSPLRLAAAVVSMVLAMTLVLGFLLPRLAKRRVSRLP